MNKFNQNKLELETNGYSITELIFSDSEIHQFIQLIENFSNDFSIRQLINHIPKIQEVLFQNTSFKDLFSTICDRDFFLSKAIYFNKPSKSNWFVGYHQDMSISVAEKIEEKGFSHWTQKKGQLGVIPPTDVLESIVTFRIHLDDTDVNNGALRVIEKSHQKGIIRIDESFDKHSLGREVTCNVDRGKIMLMKPLLLHASDKSISENDRRVIHLEFSNKEVPMGWLEQKKIS